MSMEEKKEFEVPEVTTYDKEELDLETALTGENESQFDSDRKLKENIKSVDPVDILSKLVSL
jgi:hypothetical protein